jgi:hypothetical protein
MSLDAVARRSSASLLLLGLLACADDEATGAGGASSASSVGATSASGTSSSGAPISTGAGAGAPSSTGSGGADAAGGGGGGGAPPDPEEPIDCAAVTCFHVREGGTGDGSDWASALPTLPDAPVRGAVYLFADGEYGSLELDAPPEGEATITLRKAIAGDHGEGGGWSDDLGDGQAVFGELVMVTDHWVVDGRVRDASDWQDTGAYGFRIEGRITGHTINFGTASNHARFRRLDVGGAPLGGFDPSLPSEGFYLGGFDATISDWRISECHVHDVHLPFQLANASDVVIERSWLGPNWSKETIRGQGRASNITIQYNVMKDGCQGTPGDPTAGACTGQIAMWDGDVPGSFDGSSIHGNVIWTTQDTTHSDACILVGGDDGESAQGVSASDVSVHHNTFVGIAAGRCSIRMPGDGTGNAAQNNLWYGLGDGVGTDCDATTCTTNEIVDDAGLFVDAAGGDFRLAQDAPEGVPLPAPFDRDMDGSERGADGHRDVGAFER